MTTKVAALLLPIMLPAMIIGGTASAATGVELKIGSVEGGALPFALRDVRVSCQLLGVADGSLRCAGGEAALSSAATGAVSARFDAVVSTAAVWSAAADVAAEHLDLALIGAQLARRTSAAGIALSGSASLKAHAARSADGTWLATYDAQLRSFSFSEASGRYASDKLGLRASGDAGLSQGAADLHLLLHASSGQAYVEPLFIDLAAAPVEADLRLRLRFPVGSAMPVRVDAVSLDAGQAGIFDRLLLRGSLAGLPAAPAFSGELSIARAHLDTLLKSYVAPFLAGSPWQDVAGSGGADLELVLASNRPTRVSLQLSDASFSAGTPALSAEGLSAEVLWQQTGVAPASALSWRGLKYGGLPIGGATISARVGGRDFALLRPLRMPILGGALVVDTLRLSAIATPQLQADFTASLEPVDLAALCKALGWPEFGGEISGRIPGISIRDQELAFDGGLTVKAFDGEISIDDLRMPEVFGRQPRVLADLRLRNLDLQALTQAFSFGRIEGRLSGDVDNLRLLNWMPVAFDARLYTPAGDGSRHRISQRAIDNLSSLGGGATGALQRGVLRFFKDFGYRRIGWSCRLDNGVCAMDGIAPAKNGGYLLVEGRLLPRIDVIGYERRVDWDRFVAQLLAIRGAEGVEVR